MIKYKRLFHLSVFVSVHLLMFLTVGCNEALTEPTDAFPEFFIEKGNDLDTSYISLRGTYTDENDFEIEASSWGILEYGLFLSRRNFANEVQYRMGGRCGVVSSRTLVKVTRRSKITAEEIEIINKIMFLGGRDTIEVVRTSIH